MKQTSNLNLFIELRIKNAAFPQQPQQSQHYFHQLTKKMLATEII